MINSTSVPRAFLTDTVAEIIKSFSEPPTHLKKRTMRLSNGEWVVFELRHGLTFSLQKWEELTKEKITIPDDIPATGAYPYFADDFYSIEFPRLVSHYPDKR